MGGRPKAGNPFRPWERADDLNADAVADISDPAAQMDQELTLKDVVFEMPPDELAMRLQAMEQGYSPALYAFTYFDTLDIYRGMLAGDVVPRTSSEKQVARWFGDCPAALCDGNVVIEAMGQERWERVADMLIDMLRVHDGEASPVCTTVRKYGLPESWIGMLRWIVSEGLETDFKKKLPGFAVALANGRGPPSLGLPDDQEQRTQVVAQLLLAGAKEYGRVGLAGFAVDVLRTAGPSSATLTFVDQKNLMVVVGRNSRRTLDWQLRSSGALQQAIAAWRHEKFHVSTTGPQAGEPLANYVDADDAEAGANSSHETFDDDEDNIDAVRAAIRADASGSFSRMGDAATKGDAYDEEEADLNALADDGSIRTPPPPSPAPVGTGRVSEFFAPERRRSDFARSTDDLKFSKLPTTLPDRKSHVGRGLMKRRKVSRAPLHLAIRTRDEAADVEWVRATQESSEQ